MQSVLTEENLYDMGIEPPILDDGPWYLNYYAKALPYFNYEIPEKGIKMAVLPVLGKTVPFPGQLCQLNAYTQLEQQIAMEAFKLNKPIFLGISTDCCLEPDDRINITERFCEYGVVAMISEIKPNREEGDLLVNCICGPCARIDAKRTLNVKSLKPFEVYLSRQKQFPALNDDKAKESMNQIYLRMKLYLEEIGGPWCHLLLRIMKDCKNFSSEFLIDFIAMHAPAERSIKYSLLSMGWEDRLNTLLMIIDDAFSEYQIRQLVAVKTNENMAQQQRDNYLRLQMEAIRSELGENMDHNPDIDELLKKAKNMSWSEPVNKHFHKELKKLERFNVAMPEYSLQYTYLNFLLELPWNRYNRTTNSLQDVRTSLNEDHYGLDKVKERIVEHIAVQMLRNDMKAPILCLVGPPGVGKTSLGKSIAKAIGRDYYRIALGGISDEAEIRGHRRTYVGAMPGRIMSALSKANSSNPVIILDEIDKLGKGPKGDPGQALLEVLDPEQNSYFHDNYVDIEYDLSNVFFISTANSLNNIPIPLLDRMEIIDLSGYVLEEKLEIAIRYLIPKNLKKIGFSKSEIRFCRKAIINIIEGYTNESGVRSLDRKINAILRKIACLKVEEKSFPSLIEPFHVQEYLGPVEIEKFKYNVNSYAGVVAGLAWTPMGGEVLYIETSVRKGKGTKLVLTGNLGDIMKESAMIAMEYILAHYNLIGMKEDDIRQKDLHIHVPEGSVPKDGPSAGITMAVSIASALTKRKVRKQLAMTGEMTLSGKILPVGGIKEKIIAAARAGIADIILCKKNRKEIEEIPSEYIKDLKIHYFDHISEVLEFSLLNERAEE